MEIVHVPVMYREVLENLVPKAENAILIDCTTGEGGHTARFLEKYPSLKVIGLDRDRDIQKKAIERFREYGERFTPVNTWFNDYLESAESESADLILFDLGISVFHYVESERGFSFRKDERLDMRLNLDSPLTAEIVVNEYPQEEIANIIYQYGEERYSRRIAKRIAEERSVERITSSRQLADIISQAVPKEYRYGRIHPATRSFQAIRIEVNHELDRITPALEGAMRVLKVGGRVGVITFHSLEDRQVKWFFKNRATGEDPLLTVLTKKPITPTDEECEQNAPSRSAKLRVAEKRRSI
ncbi:MAG: 16S rRNA (cytosine(1402)-N(4))-methyltransferase RsmH [Spirochaetales bacterium]|nr:16S rRNA (cytosine(1402)-N(4))-methyltransferase RsmH [Spirochaetales bacterium]